MSSFPESAPGSMYGPNAASPEDAVMASLGSHAEPSSATVSGHSDDYAARMLANERRVEVAHRRTGYSRLLSADEFRAAFAAFRTTMNADVSAVTDAADLNCTDVFVEHPVNVIERAIADEISEYRDALDALRRAPISVASRTRPVSLAFTLLPGFGARVPAAADLEAPMVDLKLQRQELLRSKRLPKKAANAVSPAALSRVALAASALPVGVLNIPAPWPENSDHSSYPTVPSEDAAATAAAAAAAAPPSSSPRSNATETPAEAATRFASGVHGHASSPASATAPALSPTAAVSVPLRADTVLLRVSVYAPLSCSAHGGETVSSSVLSIGGGSGWSGKILDLLIPDDAPLSALRDCIECRSDDADMVDWNTQRGRVGMLPKAARAGAVASLSLGDLKREGGKPDAGERARAQQRGQKGRFAKKADKDGEEEDADDDDDSDNDSDSESDDDNEGDDDDYNESDDDGKKAKSKAKAKAKAKGKGKGKQPQQPKRQKGALPPIINKPHDPIITPTIASTSVAALVSDRVPRHLLPTPSAFFFIENTFYDDMRSPRCTRLSDPIVQWSEEKERFALPGLAPYRQADMELTPLSSLRLRLGSQYLYQHQGDCRHVIVFTEMRMRAQDDIDNRAAYPLVLYRRRVDAPLCCICELHAAVFVTLGDRLAPSSPAVFCEACYDSLHVGADGKLLVGDFQVFRILPFSRRFCN